MRSTARNFTLLSQGVDGWTALHPLATSAFLWMWLVRYISSQMWNCPEKNVGMDWASFVLLVVRCLAAAETFSPIECPGDEAARNLEKGIFIALERWRCSSEAAFHV